MCRATRALFLCTGNSARSIIAEALLRHLGGGAYEAHSAGTDPKGINPLTIRALSEAGVELSGARSKHVSEFEDTAFEWVITLCDDAAERCPVFPGGARRLHWGFPDPAAVSGTEDEQLAVFRRTVQQMSERVSAFIASNEH
jgi:arsenate reductase